MVRTRNSRPHNCLIRPSEMRGIAKHLDGHMDNRAVLISAMTQVSDYAAVW